MNKGVYILALGDKTYVQWAVNLAASVKYYSPSMHVTLIHDGCIDYVSELEQSVFDTDVLMEKGDYFTTSFQPGLAKLSLYKYFKHDENIFIDADSLCITGIEELFSACEKVDIGLQVYNVANSKEEWKCRWSTWEQLKEFYGVESNVSEINSSFIYSKKNEEAERFWKQAKANFIDNLQTLWANKFPDELAFDAATSQTGISGIFDGCGDHYPVAMTSKIGDKNLSITELKNHCSIISFWGGKQPKLAYHYKNYDDHASVIHKSVFGKQNHYKHQRLMDGKIVQIAGQRLLKQSRLVEQKPLPNVVNKPDPKCNNCDR